jgi:hypothetical protein
MPDPYLSNLKERSKSTQKLEKTAGTEEVIVIYLVK